MVMGGANITMVLEARDLATQRLKEAGKQVGYLEGQVKQAGLSFFRLTGILGAVGVSSYALINLFKDQIADMEKTNRAATTLTSQLRFMGFSAEDAAGSVNSMRRALDSAAFQSLPQMDTAMKKFLADLDPESVRQIELYSDALVAVFGVDKQMAVHAMTELFAGNATEVNKITGSNEDWLVQGPRLLGMYNDIIAKQPSLKTVWDQWAEAFGPAMQNAMTAIIGTFSSWLDLFGKVGKVIGDFLNLTDTWGVNFANFLSSTLPGAIGSVIEWGKTVGGVMVGGIMTGLQSLGGFLGTFFGDLGTGAGNVWDVVLSWGRTIGGQIVGGIMTGLQTLGGFLGTLWNGLTEVTMNAWDWAKRLGSNIALGIWNGIQTLASWLTSSIWTWVTGIFNTIKDALGDLWPFGASNSQAQSNTMQAAPQSMSATSFGGRSGISGGSSQIFNVTLQVDRYAFGKVVMEVVDGSVRLAEPGVGLR